MKGWFKTKAGVTGYASSGRVCPFHIWRPGEYLEDCTCDPPTVLPEPKTIKAGVVDLRGIKRYSSALASGRNTII
jgi:hypothetical protein